jgi:hypothetical protein
LPLYICNSPLSFSQESLKRRPVEDFFCHDAR